MTDAMYDREVSAEQEARRDEMRDAKDAYACVTDELNDGSPGQLELEDLDADAVKLACQYARANNLPWPPQTGDYDRFWEAQQRKPDPRSCPRCDAPLRTDDWSCPRCGVDLGDLS